MFTKLGWLGDSTSVLLDWFTVRLTLQYQCDAKHVFWIVAVKFYQESSQWTILENLWLFIVPLGNEFQSLIINPSKFRFVSPPSWFLSIGELKMWISWVGSNWSTPGSVATPFFTTPFPIRIPRISPSSRARGPGWVGTWDRRFGTVLEYHFEVPLGSQMMLLMAKSLKLKIHQPVALSFELSNPEAIWRPQKYVAGTCMAFVIGPAKLLLDDMNQQTLWDITYQKDPKSIAYSRLQYLYIV